MIYQLGSPSVSVRIVGGMVKSRAYGGFYGLGFSLSKFDIDTSATTKNQMQCRQSCSWQLLICFDQRQIFQVFWAVYFPWSEVVWFFSSLKASLRHWFGKKIRDLFISEKQLSPTLSLFSSSLPLLFDLLFPFLFILFLYTCPYCSPYYFHCYSACF